MLLDGSKIGFLSHIQQHSECCHYDIKHILLLGQQRHMSMLPRYIGKWTESSLNLGEKTFQEKLMFFISICKLVEKYNRTMKANGICSGCFLFFL